VSMGGVTVSRATLHNFDEIERLGVALNDTVVVTRGGDVIPKIKSVKERAADGERRKIEVPALCPSCHGALTVVSSPGAAMVVQCDNKEQCVAQSLGRILHFCRRDAMDIQGLGPRTVNKLLDYGLVASPADLFLLTKESIGKVDGFKEKSTSVLHAAIADAAANRSLERLIIGLGIPRIGRASARSLALHAGSIKGLANLATLSRDDLMQLPNVAEKSAEAIHGFLTEPRVLEELVALDKTVVSASVVDDEGPEDPYSAPAGSRGGTAEEGDGGNSFAGKTFAFTGKMETLVRPEAMKHIRTLGGKTVSVVSKKTDYVVVGTDPGVKYQKALRAGCTILAEEDLLALFNAAQGADGGAESLSPPSPVS
jgi:DNA ligase (NAD+)